MAAGEKPHLMSFVSEKQLEDVRKKRQEEWEKNRKPGQAEGGLLLSAADKVSVTVYVLHVCHKTT